MENKTKKALTNKRLKINTSPNKEKKIKLGRQVILLHTGGMPGLYTKAHRIKFENELKDQIEIVK